MLQNIDSMVGSECSSICLCCTFCSLFFGQNDIEAAYQAVTILLFSWVSDRYQQRAAIIAIQTVVTIVGLVLTGYATSPAWRYAGKVSN